MNITDKDEFDNVYSSIVYAEYPKRIEAVANIDPNLAYFKYSNKKYSDKYVRISILEPKILQSDFKLDNSDIDFIIKSIRLPNIMSDMICWDVFIETINDARITEDIGNILPSNIPIPDYSKLR